MVKEILKKAISFALAFAVVLSLSCCGVGDEILIDEIPDEETILASLSDEEMEVWQTMPYIVTMRMLERYDKNEVKLYDKYLYTEIVYIDKIGRVKKFITYDKCRSSEDDKTIDWLNNQIRQNENAELVDVADIHTLIDFYNTFMRIDSDSKFYERYLVGLDVYIERHYWFELYGIRNNGKNDFETLLISSSDAGNPYIRRNHTEKNEPLDTSGRETLDIYLQLDSFMVNIPGGIGHLTDEEG